MSLKLNYLNTRTEATFGINFKSIQLIYIVPTHKLKAFFMKINFNSIVHKF